MNKNNTKKKREMKKRKELNILNQIINNNKSKIFGKKDKQLQMKLIRIIII